jgi:prepilin-type processing-associated H-X9-DG protein
VIQCPSGPERTYTDGQPYADYVGTAGIGPNAALLPRDSPAAGMWSYDESTKVADIRDGESNTLVALETSVDNGCWLAGGPATVCEYTPSKPALGRQCQFGGLHPSGSMGVFVDGHVEFLADDISPQVFEALLTIAGEQVNPPNP